MKLLLAFFIIFFIQGCSTVDKKNNSEPENVSQDFSKLTSVSPQNFNDYFESTIVNKKLNFLFDESMDFSSEEEIKKLSPENKDIYLLSSSCKGMKEEKFKDIVNKYFNRYHKLPAFWNVIGNCHLELGNTRTALLFYNKSLELDASYAPTFNNLGIYYFKLGNVAKSLVAFQKAHSISKFAKTPAYNLSLLYLRFNLLSDASPLIKSLISQYPNEDRLIRLSAYLDYASGDYSKAIFHFEKIQNSTIVTNDDRLYLTYSYLKTGDAVKARVLLKSIKTSELSKKSEEFYFYINSKVQGAS